MTIMDQEKETPGNPKDASKKICPRAARENVKKKSEINSLKSAHTGLRFHFDKKKLVTHEFAFNSVSKTEKVSRCRIQEKSVEKKKTEESTKTTEVKKIGVLMDSLKISKSEVSCNREKSPSRKEMPKSPVVERLTAKRACTRCSRCSKSPKEEKIEIKTSSKVAKNQDQPLKTIKKENQAAKTVKLETSQSLKTVTCKKKCSKLAKLLEEPQDKSLKPKSILKHTEKSASGDHEKNDVSKNSERTLDVEKPKSCSADKGKPNCKNEVKADSFWPSNTENIPSTSDITNSDDLDKEKKEIHNGTEHPAVADTKACLLNGTRHDEHVCDPHFGYESSEIAKKELESVKSASKIPRKTHDATGPKTDASVNKGTIQQPLILEA